MEYEEFKGVVIEVLREQQELAVARNDDLLAKLSAQRFLLETLYANAFTDRLEDFTAFMEQALDQTRQASTKAGPMTQEQEIETKARVAAELQHYQTSVERRLRQ